MSLAAVEWWWWAARGSPRLEREFLEVLLVEWWAVWDQGLVRLFYFYIFRKYFLQKYIFNITFYSSVPLPPGSGVVGTYM